MVKSIHQKTRIYKLYNDWIGSTSVIHCEKQSLLPAPLLYEGYSESNANGLITLFIGMLGTSACIESTTYCL